MIDNVLYISRATLKTRHGEPEISEIIAQAETRNSDLGVTGAFVFTETYFAQILEGNRSALDELMDSITRDYRHTDVRVLLEERNVHRRFPSWSLAYSGASLFVRRHVKILMQTATPTRRADSARLLDLMSACVSATLPTDKDHMKRKMPHNE